MVYQRVAHYLWLKGDTYYFNRRVPKDMQGHYKSSRIIICLKTTRKDTALRSAKSMAQRLEDYWLSLRLSQLDIPALHLLMLLRSEITFLRKASPPTLLSETLLTSGLSSTFVFKNMG